MNRRVALTIVTAAVWFGVVSAQAQDKYTLKIPDGLAFSEFKGYETWQVISVSHAADTINAIVGNPTIIAAYAAGIPGNGKPFPDGSKMVKIQYLPKKTTDPGNPTIPDRLRNVAFMAKDSKRFADSGGWGWGVFNYDAASGKFTPEGTGAKCGFACHTSVKAKDYVFTAFGAR
jgi:hypothetical protein